MNKKLIGKTYYIDPEKIGDMNDGIKKNRPIYILKSINNEFVLGVLSTTQFSTGRKNTFQDKKYVKYGEGNSGLRLSLSNGWTTIKKSEIFSDWENVNEYIELKENQKEELIKYYDTTIKEERRRLKDV